MQYIQYVLIWLFSYLQVKFNCLPVFIFTYHVKLSSYLPKMLDRLMRDFRHPPRCKLELPLFVYRHDKLVSHPCNKLDRLHFAMYGYHIDACSDLRIKLEYFNVYISRWTLFTSTYQVGLSSYLQQVGLSLYVYTYIYIYIYICLFFY
jgi:hypothetical protein